MIKSPHIDNILNGKKTWEMRSQSTKIRGLIGLIKSGSGIIWGQATLVDCLGPLSLEERLKTQDRHLITPERLNNPDVAKYDYAWVLENVETFSTPRQYDHPSGAVTWVTLT